MIRIHRLGAALLLAAAPVLALGAQAPTAGAAVAVIERAEIEASGARTLSELLTARVPGLSVRRRGGVEAEGSEVRSRGLATPVQLPLGAAPMLVVDGVLADGRQARPLPITSVRVSRLDDFAPADVERIEILRGPAAAALYGTGATSGVIAITTRRGTAGPLRLEAAGSVGLASLDADFPANYQLTSGAPGAACNPLLPSPNTVGCTPTTLYRFNPLEQASPFATGRASSGRAALAGTVLGTTVFVGGRAERAGGVTGDDWESRLGARASVERAIAPGLTLSARGGYAGRDAAVPTRGSVRALDNVILRGLLGTAYDDTARGYAGTFMQTGVTPTAARLARSTGVVRVEWRARPWLTVDALGGQDRARANALRTHRTANFGNEQWNATRDRWTSGTLHAGVDARGSLLDRVALATHLAVDDVRLDDEANERIGAPITFLDGRQRTRIRTREATLRQRLSWRSVDVDAGTRWALGGSLGAPFGETSARSLGASWRPSAPRSGVDLRLRASTGLALVLPPNTLLSERGCVSTCDLRQSAGRGRRAEHEAGLDASFGERGRLELTWFDAETRGVPLDVRIVGGQTIVTSSVRNRGIEVLADARWLARPGATWRSTLALTTLRNRLTEASAPGIPGGGTFSPGHPLAGVWTGRYWWDDLNGDGVPSLSEVNPASRSFVGPSSPTLEVGLRNDVTLGRRLSLGTLLDYRGGHHRVNASGEERCRPAAHSCRQIQDPSLPIAEQVRALAIRNGYTRIADRASFFRLREVALELEAPRRAARALRTDRLALRLVGQNLALWTPYAGLDPEIGGTPETGYMVQQELFDTPLPRTVRLELRLGGGSRDAVAPPPATR